jgi:malonyl CoA-acyl carrier protein transacylase/NADP-dependent 3-hydroxy acid dehydrogenase YdfG
MNSHFQSQDPSLHLTGDFSLDSLFSGTVKWVMAPNFVPNKSQICFVFPGQGSMFPGMGKGFSNNSYFINYFKKADALAEKYHWPSISHYAFAPMRLTLEQQEKVEALALFTFEVAMARSLVEANYRPQVVTAHSFGEYAALVVSGIWDFETGFECVLRREQILPEKNAMGYMIAIAAAKTQIPDLIGNSLYFISNINSPHQTVISASWENISQIETSLSSKGVKFKRLASPQPFHSPLLNEAAKEMSQFAKSLGDLAQSQRTAIFSGVLKRFVSPGNKLKEDLQAIIAKQLLEPVDFEHQIKTIEMHCSHFIEIGPKPLLVDLIKSNFQKKDSQSSAALSLLKTQTKQTTNFTLKRSQVSEPILNRVNAIISKFTGYSIQEIGFEDRFQDDLGIDSIKTMEISIEVINELKLPRELLNSAQQIKTVGELAYKVQSQISEPQTQPPTTQSETHFDLYHEDYLPKPRLETIYHSSDKSDCRLVTLDFNLNLGVLIDEEKLPSKLIFQFSPAPVSSSLSELKPTEFDIKVSNIIRFFKQFQVILSSDKINSKTKIAIISDETPEPEALMIHAFLKSLKKENAIAFATHILFKNSKFSITQKTSIADLDLGFGIDTDIQYDSHTRKNLGLRKLQEPSLIAPKFGTLVAIGGATGITRKIVEHFIKTGKWNLFIIGRSPAGDESITSTLEEFKKVTKKIQYYQIDATQLEPLRLAFSEIKQKEGSIDFIIQGAGVDLSKRFIDKNESEIRAEFVAKALSSFNLRKLIEEFEIPDSLLLSSIIARFGNAGQTIYSAANSMAESLWSSASKERNTMIVQWPPWDGVGMTERKVIYEILKSSGVSMLAPNEAVQLLDKAILSKGGVVLDPGDLGRFQGSLISTSELGGYKTEIIPSPEGVNVEFTLDKPLQESLKDHALNGKIWVPLALVSYWFSDLARALTSKQISIQNLIMIRPVEISSAQERFRITVKNFSENDTQLNISLFHSDHLIAECKAQTGITIRSVTDLKNQKPFKVVDTKKLYQPEKLFHGECFRFLKQLKIFSENSAESELQFPWLEKTNHYSWWPWVSIVDSGLQTLGAAALEMKNWQGLPIGAEKIELSSSLSFSEPLFWKLRDIEFEERHLKGNLFLVNKENLCLGVLWQAKFQLVKFSTL